MPSKEIEKFYNDTIARTNKAKSFPPANGDGRVYTQQVEVWGKRVRRDIIVLEHHIMKLREYCKMTGKPDDLFFDGDPGDPPPSTDL